MIIGRYLTPLNSFEYCPFADVRWPAAVTTTRAGKCRMSVKAAPVRAIVLPDPSSAYLRARRAKTARRQEARGLAMTSLPGNPYGTRSSPPGSCGLQRERRLCANRTPVTKPYLSIVW